MLRRNLLSELRRLEGRIEALEGIVFQAEAYGMNTLKVKGYRDNIAGLRARLISLKSDLASLEMQASA